MSRVELINWEISDQAKPIEMTVALPAFNAKKIIWLALESLKNQKDVEFGWELIIWEEGTHSKEIVESFIGQLPNCQKIIYKSLRRKISLLEKWVGIAKEVSDSSKIYVLQSADDYSPSHRLHIHYLHFQDETCFFSNQGKSLFFNLSTKRKIFYYQPSRLKNNLSMAYRMKHFRRVPLRVKHRNIDGYLFTVIRRIVGSQTKIRFDHDIDPENWKTSVFTDGCNNISINRRRHYYKTSWPFKSYIYAKNFGYENMEKYFPQNVIQFLQEWK